MVEFIVELRPGWFYGDRREKPSWSTELTVEVDCQHTPDHAAMHTAFEQDFSAATPEQAVESISEATQSLEELAALSLDHWIAEGGK